MTSKDAAPAWTKGPWVVQPSYGLCGAIWSLKVLAGNNRGGVHAISICGVHKRAEDHGRPASCEAIATAYLIAASPALYEALLAAREELEGYHLAQFGEDYNNPSINAALSLALGEKI